MARILRCLSAGGNRNPRPTHDPAKNRLQRKFLRATRRIQSAVDQLTDVPRMQVSPLRSLTIVVLTLLCTAPLTFAFQDAARKESPFDGLRWVGVQPEVRVGQVWYRPVSLEAVAVADILAFCGRRWPGQQQKRFGEDLVEAFELMGHTLPSLVRLELTTLDDGRPVVLEGVPSTRAKRQAILAASRVSAETPVAPPRLVPKAAALQDLDLFRARLVDQFAYLHLKDLELDTRLAEIRAALPDEVDVGAVAHQLRELVLRSGDGHASVTSVHDPTVARFTPFLLEEVEGGVVAVRPDRAGFIDDKRPFVRALDGRPLSDWLTALRPTIAAGSPQLVRQRALRALRELDLARRSLGLEERDSAALTLAAKADGGPTKEVTLALSAVRPTYGVWPSSSSARLTSGKAAKVRGGVGYLRLADMDDELVPELRARMHEFKATGGLVVDVRGNGGGQRGLLLALAAYLLAPDATPVVVNVAAYRASEVFRDDHLGGSRHLFRADDPRWTEVQRAAIAECAARFTPEWPLPEGFSAWHYLVLDRTGHADEYHYTAPVVVLADAGCFSATDIFLAALAELPNVTLVGMPSSGGSARAVSFELPRTGISVSCASMASFRVDGRLFDGRGVEVDHEVPRAPRDVLAGNGDAQLDAALAPLRR